MSLTKKTILITGASSGLGRELALIFASHGHDLVLTARRQERLTDLKAQLEARFPIRVFVYAADLSKPEAPFEIAKFVFSNKIEIDILINNAGFGCVAEFLSMDHAKIEQMYRVNVLSVIQLIHLCLPSMISRKAGHIVNIASIAALFPGPWMAAYFSTKSAMYSLSKSLEYELKGTGVEFSIACPGPFKTEFQSVAYQSNHKENLPSVKDIAVEIFDGIIRNKRLIIPGWRYQWMYILRRIVPGDWWAKIIGRFHRSLIASQSQTV